MLVYLKESDQLSLQGYVDPDFASTEERKSISGYAFFIGGALVSYCSVRQKSVSTSTAEVEYVALCEATKEAIWLRLLLSELGYFQTGPTTLHEDNQSCISMNREDVHHSRTKHIDVKYHFTREQIELNKILVKYISTTDQVANIFTKQQDKARFELDCKRLGLVLHPTT